APLRYPTAQLPVDPYVLGVWLADGTSTAPGVTLGHREVVDHLVAAGCEVRQRKARGTAQFATGPWIGRGQRQPGNAKLSFDLAGQPRPRLADGETGRSLALEYSVSPATISLIRSRQVWRAHPSGPGLHELLRGLSVLARKHIPDTYLRGSDTQRLALLQ